MNESIPTTAGVESVDAQRTERRRERFEAWSPAVVAQLDRWLRRVLQARLRLGRDELDELVQETWVAALRTCPAAPPPKAWFYVTAVRRQRRLAERRSATLDDVWLGQECAPAEFEPQRQLELHEFVDRAGACLSALAPSQRELVARHALAGEPLLGAARALGCSRKWARLAFERAAGGLRSHLRDWCG